MTDVQRRGHAGAVKRSRGGRGGLGSRGRGGKGDGKERGGGVLPGRVSRIEGGDLFEVLLLFVHCGDFNY